MTREEGFILKAIELSRKSVINNEGGPFGCIIVKGNEIIGQGNNKVTSTNDPTAHAEIVAIRKACKTLETFYLTGCEIYTSCEPCPMCMGAIYWARIEKVYYAGNRNDATASGFDDSFIYDEIMQPLDKRKIPMICIERNEALKVFKLWMDKDDKVNY